MFRRYLIAGLLVWVPLWVTVLALKFLSDLMDKSFALLPTRYQPDNLFGVHIPGLGILFVVLIVFFTGLIATNFFGKRLVALWEKLLARIPLVRSIYSAVKQVLHTVFANKSESFRNVLLVQYPRLGMWSIAFQTSTAFKEAQSKIGDELITVFIPTTPNPTSGFLMMVPKADTIDIELSVDEALKFVVSLGMVMPGSAEEAQSSS